MSKKSNQFSPEVREGAVRMVREHRSEYPSLWAAIESIAPKIGCVPQTLNAQSQRDSQAGECFFRPGGARPPSEVLKKFVDQHRQAYGVESICKVLQIAPQATGATPPSNAILPFDVSAIA